MGSKNKLRRFKENDTFDNLIQPTREEILSGDFVLKGNWNRDFFKNDNPITLELGCGKGEYSVALSRKHKNRNFIGIDLKGARMWRGAKTALEENIENVGFIRTQIELIEHLFETAEVDEIWITFPDPQIKYQRTKHRLTNEAFLNRYKKVLKPGGYMNLKTDSEFMHGYTLGLLHGLDYVIEHSNHDVYRDDYSPEEVVSVQTFYESQYLEIGKKITYIKFKLEKNGK